MTDHHLHLKTIQQYLSVRTGITHYYRSALGKYINIIAEDKKHIIGILLHTGSHMD